MDEKNEADLIFEIRKLVVVAQNNLVNIMRLR